MKRILTESTNVQIIEEEKRAQLSQLFRSAPFQDLIKKTEPKVCVFIIYIRDNYFIFYNFLHY